MFSIKEKVAVITGGGSGIGLATVKRFCTAGAKVVIADITDQTRLADELGCTFVKTDVTQEEEVRQLMQTAFDTYGPIDIVINNAGIIMPEQLLVEADAADFERMFRINVFGVLYGLKYAPAYMKDGGSIINTASNSADEGFSGYGAYGSSKAAVVHLTKTAAIELAARRIRVNCICPNTVDTPLAYAEGCETELHTVGIITPLARMCRPEECAALFHFLAADDCSYITGEDIYIDGGLKAGPGTQMFAQLLKNR
ncbi:SDR family NAD(P)-dependent oxidoreductase [Brevibacillus sp. B_LB10_24]|uniref:SDR family NAD(P)-dependent oxidoreductase n=1 Tax=Brevibacillus sp. B_LB10_24 TaxID=3380645 RepID=UPI0038BB68D3